MAVVPAAPLKQHLDRPRHSNSQVNRRLHDRRFRGQGSGMRTAKFYGEDTTDD